MQKYYRTLFKGFLVIYLIALLYHTKELTFCSWVTWVSLIIGITLALVAHARGGISTIVLLLVHMTIEWSEYAHHGKYLRKDLLFYGFHTCLDFIFLLEELTTHLLRFRYPIMVVVFIGLVSLFRYISQDGSAASFLETGIISQIIEPVVLGGILGCTLSHLFEGKKLWFQKTITTVTKQATL